MAKNEQSPFHPSGSPLADQVAQAIDEELFSQADTAQKAIERKQSLEEEAQRKTEEVKKSLQQISESLGVMKLLEELRDSVWQGGEIELPVINTNLENPFWAKGEQEVSGSIDFALVFTYDDIHTKQTALPSNEWKKHNGCDGLREWFIGSSQERIDITIDASYLKGADRLTFRDKVKDSRWVTVTLKGNEMASTELERIIIDDSKNRALSGELPIGRVAERARERFGLAGQKEYFHYSGQGEDRGHYGR